MITQIKNVVHYCHVVSVWYFMKRLLLLACLLCTAAMASDSESFDMDNIQERGGKDNVRTDIQNTWKEWVKNLENNLDEHQSKTSSQIEEKEYKAVCSVLQKINNKECNEVDLKEIAWNIIDLCMENNTCAKNIVKHASSYNFDDVAEYEHEYLANDVYNLLYDIKYTNTNDKIDDIDLLRQLMLLPEYIMSINDDFGIFNVNAIFEQYIDKYGKNCNYCNVYFLKSLFRMLCRFPDKLSEKVSNSIDSIVQCVENDIGVDVKHCANNAKNIIYQWLSTKHVEV